MTESTDIIDYQTFAEHVRRTHRYVLKGDTLRFIEQVRESAHSRVVSLPANTSFVRAQVGCDDEVTGHFFEDGSELLRSAPFDEARMSPFRDRASEGRANPKGIPVLYLAEDEETAAAEVRAPVGARVSLARFALVQDARLVDCSCTDQEQALRMELRSATSRGSTETLWASIDRAFSLPLTDTDSTAEYAPTQILAEFFKAEGFDGIRFRSSVERGRCVVLFEPELAEYLDGNVKCVKRVEYELGDPPV